MKKGKPMHARERNKNTPDRFYICTVLGCCQDASKGMLSKREPLWLTQKAPRGLGSTVFHRAEAIYFRPHGCSKKSLLAKIILLLRPASFKPNGPSPLSPSPCLPFPWMGRGSQLLLERSPVGCGGRLSHHCQLLPFQTQLFSLVLRQMESLITFYRLGRVQKAINTQRLSFRAAGQPQPVRISPASLCCPERPWAWGRLERASNPPPALPA